MREGDLDRRIAKLALERGLVTSAELARVEKLLETGKTRGRRYYLAQLLVVERLITASDLLALENDLQERVYECPRCSERYTAKDVYVGGPPAKAGGGDKKKSEARTFACGGCGKKLALKPGAGAELSRIEVLASEDPHDLAVTLEEVGSESSSISELDLDRYEVESELGRGGYGVVLKARHKDLDRPIALKVVKAGAHVDRVAIERFVREGRAASRLRHPNIVQVYDIGRQGDIFALAMELVTGASLKEKLVERGALPWSEAARLVAQVLSGVQHAHENGVVHRDLKPSNIIIEEATGTPRLIDFGLAKDATSRAELTAPNTIIGTPFYLAPEQVEGRSSDADARSDVFALGVILYECLTGKKPFVAKSRSEVYAKILQEKPVRPSALVPELPEAIERVCLKALEKKAADRFQSAKEFRSALLAAVVASGGGGDGAEDLTRADVASGSRKKSTGSRATLDAAAVEELARTEKQERSTSRSRSTTRSRADRIDPTPVRSGVSPVVVGAFAIVAIAAGVIGWSLRGGSSEPAIAASPSPSVSPTPIPSPTPTPSPIPSPTPTPTPIQTPTPTPIQTPTPTPTPIQTPTPTPTPEPPSPEPSASPSPTPGESPTPTPAPIAAKLDDGKGDAAEFPTLTEKVEKDWVLRAFTTNFWAVAPHDATSVRALRLALLDRRELVRAFALRGLALRENDLLLGVGSKALFDALVANLKTTSEPYVAKTARAVLRRLADGEEFKNEAAARAWWQSAGETKSLEAAVALKSAPPPPPSNEKTDTRTRAREVTTYWTQTRDAGLDAAICLDVTDSMDKTLASVQAEVKEIASFFMLLLKDRVHMAAITYGDEVVDTVPLTANLPAFVREVEKFKIFSDPNDKTIEEGPDRAIDRALTTLAWRHGARRVIVVIGDAPMHKQDYDKSYAQVEKAAKAGFTINTIACRPPKKYAHVPPYPNFGELARRGNGVMVELEKPEELIVRLLVLLMGTKYEQDLDRFVRAYREVTGAANR